MSLHDIDKNHFKRINPQPNATDAVNQRMAHGTVQNQNSQEIAQDDGLKFKERQILAVQDGFEKAAFGFYGTAGKFGLKVAQDGVNVTTATDDQLVFNSEQNVFKIVGSGTIISPTVTTTDAGAGLWSTNSATTSVAHGLSFIPMTFGVLSIGPSIYSTTPYTTPVFSNSGSVRFDSITLYSDSTNITLKVSVMGLHSGTTIPEGFYTTKYYILQETVT